MKILGTVKIKPKNKWQMILQALKVFPSVRTLSIDSFNAKTTYEICAELKHLKALEAKDGEPMFAQIAEKLPLLTHIIVLTQKGNEAEQQQLKRMILDQWTDKNIVNAVNIIFSSLDFSDFVLFLETIGKIKAVGV